MRLILPVTLIAIAVQAIALIVAPIATRGNSSAARAQGISTVVSLVKNTGQTQSASIIFQSDS